MSADHFGLHARIEGGCDIAALLDRCDALAQALGFGRSGRTTSSARGMSAYQRAGAEPLHLNVGVDSPTRTDVLVYEEFALVRQYDPALIEALFAGICDIAAPALARAFRGPMIDLVTDSEIAGVPQHLEWWQYFGSAMCDRIGHVRLLFGPFYRLEPRDTGACIVSTGPPPYRDRDAAESAEDRRLWDMRRDANRFIAGQP